MGDGMTETRMSEHGVPIAEVIPLKAMKKMIADHMSRSHLTAAPVTILEEYQVDGLIELRDKINSAAEIDKVRKISFSPLLLKAAAQALEEHPYMNATMGPDEIQILAEINIGLAVATPDGNLMVPVIRHANRKSLAEVADEAAELQEKAVKGCLTLNDVGGGTFTVSNVGLLPNARWQTPIINQPQAAILAVGAIRQAAVVKDGSLAVGSVLSVSLTFDHRLVNGLPADLFLQTLAGFLSKPESLRLGQ